MASFLENITKFRGNGEKNASGQTLEEFLAEYDPGKYQTPSCTTDAVIFAHSGQLFAGAIELKLLLVKRSNHPSIGYWALPGGFVNMRENLEASAKRELEEETGVQNLIMEQIGAYGDFDRDPRTRVITTAYMALVEEHEVKVQAGDDAADAAWCSLRVEEDEEELCEDGKTKCSQIRLYLSNADRGLDTKVVVEHRCTIGLIREEHYQVLDAGMIAVDHGAIIAQAYQILRGRVNREME